MQTKEQKRRADAAARAKKARLKKRARMLAADGVQLPTPQIENVPQGPAAGGSPVASQGTAEVPSANEPVTAKGPGESTGLQPSAPTQATADAELELALAGTAEVLAEGVRIAMGLPADAPSFGSERAKTLAALWLPVARRYVTDTASMAIVVAAGGTAALGFDYTRELRAYAKANPDKVKKSEEPNASAT